MLARHIDVLYALKSNFFVRKEQSPMQKQDIETYLAELGQTLQDLGVQQPVRILLVGGRLC